MVTPYPSPPPQILGPNGQPLPPSGAMGGPMMPGMPGMMPPMGGMPGLPPFGAMLGGGEDFSVQVGPVYPARMLDENGEPKIPKKPTATDCKAKATADERKHKRLVKRFLKDLRRFRQVHAAGVFEDYDPNVDVSITSTEGSTQVMKVANMGAGMPWRYEVPYRTRKEKQASRRVEAWADYFFQVWAELHRKGNNASLKWEMFFYALVYGRIVGRCLCDLKDPDYPWTPELLDPARVFPTFGGPKDGLTVVTEVMRKTYGEVVDEYDDNAGHGEIARKLLGKQQKDSGNYSRASLDRDQTGKFVVYCDAWWHGAWFDDVEVVPITAHEYLEVPYVVVLAPGEPGSLNRPEDDYVTLREWYAGYRRGDSLDEWDLALKGPSFYQYIENALLNQEALHGLLMTQAKQATNPATVIESPYEDDNEPFDFGPGGNNRIRPGERLQNIPTSPRPADVAPLLSQFGSEIDKGMLPDPMFGTSDGSNISGYAEDSMRGAARDRIIPYFEMVQSFAEGILGLAARQFRNFGQLTTVDGRYTVPYLRKPGGNAITDDIENLPPEMLMAMAQLGIAPPEDEPEVQVSLEDFDLVGSRIKVKVATVSLQNLTQMMNVANMALNSPMPVWSWEYAAEQLNIDDPDLMWQQIVTNKALMDPDILKTVVYPMALWKSGNTQAYQMYMARLQAPPPGMMPGGGGGGQQLPSGVPGPQTVQGDSQPALQQGPGPGSGPQGGSGGQTDFNPQ